MSETYSGSGLLIVNGAEHPCTYRLDIQVGRGRRTGAGTVAGSFAGLWAAFDAAKAVIRMKDGRAFPVIITRFSAGQDTAPFQMAGDFIEESSDET